MLNKARQGLRLISKYFLVEKMIKLSTAFFYSRLYYGARVCLSSGLSAQLKKKLWQSSSKMLKIVQKDWQGQHSFKTLHKISNRATPEMWLNYITARAIFDVINSGVPEDNMTENYLNSERHQGLQFTRSNKIKIGFNCLSIRLQKVLLALKDCTLQETKMVFKLRCKKLFITDELRKLWNNHCNTFIEKFNFKIQLKQL